GCCDRVAEPDEFALHPTVPPGRVLRRDADRELADRGCRGRPSGTPPARVVPPAGRPAAGARRAASPGSPRTPRPTGGGGSAGIVPRATAVARLVADPADLAAQDCVLVPEHQQLGIL